MSLIEEGKKKVLNYLRVRQCAWKRHRAISVSLGAMNSDELGVASGPGNQPIPWFTYAATSYLDSLKLSGCDIFEYGGGASTLFFAARGANIKTVESSPEFFAKLKKATTSFNNVSLISEPGKEGFIQSICGSGTDFDIIIIDSANWREECAEAAANKLRSGGFILVDNADWLGEICKKLRAYSFTQIDFTGLGPVDPHRWTTSMFFKGHLKFSSLLSGPVAKAGRRPSPFK